MAKRYEDTRSIGSKSAGPGDEEHEEEYRREEVEDEVEEESILTEYDVDDFHSGAVITQYSTIPEDLFEFEHSYGYNCQKYFNLCACDETVVCWAAGSIISFMDVTTKQIWFKRTSTGGSVGAITSYRQEPNYRIAIAEGREGANEPLIILYFWPQMEIDAVLREGTANAYSVLDFSPNGELLASIGKDPDYNITIWNWQKHKIILRTSAFTFDVNNVMFSPYCPGQLTTAGAAHIKFWKMAETFTGLKLKGELGRFGKTEICDVLGIYPMPDEKVLSGCEWGNILVWEAGLVKVEVTKKGRKTCHSAPIIQFMLSPACDEVTTIARDGCVRAWYWDTVEQADPPEDDPYVELNPVAETCVEGCQIMCLKHKKDDFWYAQDGNGGIWVVELELDKIECEHSKVMISHASSIVAIVALRLDPLLLTAGADGAIHIYNIETHQLKARYVFPAAITCIYYPPPEVDETSCIVVVGFADGIMRILFLHSHKILLQKGELLDIHVSSALSLHDPEHEVPELIDLISLLKPHSKAITQITVNDAMTLLVTCSEDSTIFMYKLVRGAPFTLERLGYIDTPNVIAYMTWKPDEERTLLLCGQVGFVMEAVLPNVPIRTYAQITTYKLEFVKYKESLIKKQFMRRKPFPDDEDLASLDEEAAKAQAEADMDYNIDDDEEWVGEVELVESESMLGTTITWAKYCEDGLWIVQKGTGAILLIQPGSNKILKYGPFPDGWCDDITVLKFVCEDKYILVGTNTGYIRMFHMPTEDEDNPDIHRLKWQMALDKLARKLKGRRLAVPEKQPIPRLDFYDYYYLPMHDFYTGVITCFEFSFDGRRFFTCGLDGNIFSYIINFPEPLLEIPRLPDLAEKPIINKIKEPSTLEGELMSHEQLKQKEEYDKMMTIANAHKKRVREQLAELTVEYNKLIKANKLLPPSQQLDVTLDPRPLVVQEQEIEELRALAVRKLAHQLEASDIGLAKMFDRNIIQLDVYPFTLKAIRDPAVMIRPLRQKNLSIAFQEQMEEVYQKMAEAALRLRRTESTTRRIGPKRMSWGPPRVASFLLGLPSEPPHPLKKALRNYHTRLNRHHRQLIEWQEHLSRKPDPTALPPGAADALKTAETTIGNRLLKTHDEYVAPPGHNCQLRVCLTRKEIYDIKREFNVKVLGMRDLKVRLVERMKNIGERLAEIHMEIPPKLAREPPVVPELDEELEFPENNLEINIEAEIAACAIRTPSRKMSQKMAPDERRQSSVYPQPRTKAPKVAPFVTLEESRPLLTSWELLRVRSDSTPMENEMRDRRINRHLYEQEMLLSDAEVSIHKFDSRLRLLQRERIRVQEKSTLLELHLYQLHQEMNVLNKFEAHEEKLAEKVYAKMMQIKSIQDQIHDCEQRIQEHEEEKEQMDEKCQDLHQLFKRLVHDNKFADFLRKIFKKKYKPPRDRDEDDSSESESSSSSSEEEEEGSMDSRDIGPIRLDPNICPEGCDRDLYDKTYELRNNRHKYEQGMIEQDRMMDLLRRDIDNHLKNKRKVTLQLDKRKNTLREFMMEKQSCMNDIQQVVVLRYDQIRAAALRGCTGPQGLSNVVVFPEAVLTKLRKRVLELQEEITQQRLRAKINRTHLFRMNIDLREMERQAAEIRAQMRDVLTRKLGKPRKVDRTLDDLLRQMARRHKFSLNLKIMPQMLSQLRSWRNRYTELERKYLAELNQYSDRLRLAAALQAEVLPRKVPKDPSTIVGGYTTEEYHRDVIRLRIVRSHQIQQIKALEEEIQSLRMKPLDLKGPFASAEPPERERSMVYLFTIPRTTWKPKRKYFPTTPLGSTHMVMQDVNITKLLFDCLDSMRMTRDQADELLKDVVGQLPDVVSGAKSRYEIVDKTALRWITKSGGDPKYYKKQTRVFDALAALSDRLIREHVHVMEGDDKSTKEVMDKVEESIKDIIKDVEPLCDRIGPALATLLHNAHTEDIETDETMAALVSALVDEEHPLTTDSIDKIEVYRVIEDIKAHGVQDVPDVELQHVVIVTLECLRAQFISVEEAQALAAEVDKAMTEAADMNLSSLDSPAGSASSRASGAPTKHRLKRDTSTTSDGGSRMKVVDDDEEKKIEHPKKQHKIEEPEIIDYRHGEGEKFPENSLQNLAEADIDKGPMAIEPEDPEGYDD